jgi:hypothetical protein
LRLRTFEVLKNDIVKSGEKSPGPRAVSRPQQVRS